MALDLQHASLSISSRIGLGPHRNRDFTPHPLTHSAFIARRRKLAVAVTAAGFDGAPTQQQQTPGSALSPSTTALEAAAAAANTSAAFAVAAEATSVAAAAAAGAVKLREHPEIAELSVAAGTTGNAYTASGFRASQDVLAQPSVQYPSCPKWRRVLLKVSGEALAGDGSSNIDPKVTASIAKEVAMITRLGVEVAIVVGGGNFFRGATWAGASGIDRASADQIGMLATVMNAIFLQGSLESVGVPTRVQTAFRMSEVAEPYIRRRAIRHLEKGRVVIFAAGTGNPFFTTDTAAALRAAEINAEVVLKGTNVDGVYDSDPRVNENARLLHTLSLREVTVQDLRVMDITAITLCAENKIPVVVFNLNTPGNITRALSGEPIGTSVNP